MLTVAEINAGDIRILTAAGQLALANLVKRSTRYKRASGFYGDVRAKILAACELAFTSDPTVTGAASVAAADAAALVAGATDEDLANAKALAATAARLPAFTGIVFEDEGSEEVGRGLFTTPAQWESWAEDILDTLFDTTVITGPTMVAVRRYLDTLGTTEGDELLRAVRGPRRLGYIR